MSAALATADRPNPPDPSAERPAAVAGAAAPERITRLLVLIRWIISYGTELASTIQQRATRPDFQFFANRYRKGDFAIIVARIKRGLMLAAGLEAHLAERAAKGRDVSSAPLHTPSSGTSDSTDPKRPRAPRRTNIIDLPLDRLPTAEEIAEELRCRPVGAVLADICRDLGIMPEDLPQELRPVLHDAIVECGGQLITLLWGEFNDQVRDSEAAQAPGGKGVAAPTESPATARALATAPTFATGPP